MSAVSDAVLTQILKQLETLTMQQQTLQAKVWVILCLYVLEYLNILIVRCTDFAIYFTIIASDVFRGSGVNEWR